MNTSKESFENSSQDTQKLILNKLSPFEVRNLFIASKKLKNTFDTEMFWIEKAKQCNNKILVNAKERCLLGYKQVLVEKAKLKKLKKQVVKSIDLVKRVSKNITIQRGIFDDDDITGADKENYDKLISYLNEFIP